MYEICTYPSTYGQALQLPPPCLIGGRATPDEVASAHVLRARAVCAMEEVGAGRAGAGITRFFPCFSNIFPILYRRKFDWFMISWFLLAMMQLGVTSYCFGFNQTWFTGWLVVDLDVNLIYWYTHGCDMLWLILSMQFLKADEAQSQPLINNPAVRDGDKTPKNWSGVVEYGGILACTTRMWSRSASHIDDVNKKRVGRWEPVKDVKVGGSQVPFGYIWSICVSLPMPFWWQQEVAKSWPVSMSGRWDVLRGWRWGCGLPTQVKEHRVFSQEMWVEIWEVEIIYKTI